MHVSTETVTDPKVEAAEYVASLKRTFGDLPTWGMVEMAYRWGRERSLRKEDDETHG